MPSRDVMMLPRKNVASAQKRRGQRHTKPNITSFAACFVYVNYLGSEIYSVFTRSGYLCVVVASVGFSELTMARWLLH